MRRDRRWLVVAVAGSALAGAGIAWTLATGSPGLRLAPGKTQAKTSFRPTVGDASARYGTLGTVVFTLPPVFADEAGEVEHEFVVANALNRTVKFGKPTWQCTCTNATIGASELAPGGETSLNMKVDLRGRSGLFATECTVYHDAGEPWRYRLQVQIDQRAVFEPDLIQLGSDVEPGVEIERDFVVLTYSRGGIPPVPLISVLDAVEGVSLVNGKSTTEALSDGMVRRTTAASIRLTPPGECDAGFCEIATDLPRVPGATGSSLRVHWHVDPVYEVAPKRVFFTAVGKTEEKAECDIVVRRRDGAPFQVKALHCARRGVTCGCATKGASETEHTLTVRLDPTDFKGFFYGEVKVETNDTANPMLRIPVAASR